MFELLMFKFLFFFVLVINLPLILIFLTSMMNWNCWLIHWRNDEIEREFRSWNLSLLWRCFEHTLLILLIVDLWIDRIIALIIAILTISLIVTRVVLIVILIISLRRLRRSLIEILIIRVLIFTRIDEIWLLILRKMILKCRQKILLTLRISTLLWKCLHCIVTLPCMLQIFQLFNKL